MSFFDLGLVQGQIVPELIMAENKDPFRLTEFQKRVLRREQEIEVRFFLRVVGIGFVVVDNRLVRKREKREVAS